MQGAETNDIAGQIVPGAVVAGKYRITRILGAGGMGLVAEAVHEALGQRVAIKFLRAQTLQGEATVRFLREAKAAAQMRSEHVARVTDVATLEGGTPYFVMEYLEGRDLDVAVATDGPLPVSTAVDYVLQACQALAEAHVNGIVHRDLKPANLFLTETSDGGVRVKLLDFGISKYVAKGVDAELTMTKTRSLMGTPLYMAPEQMRSLRRVDHRADIWSVGIVLHEILTGQTPFIGDTLPEICAAIAADEPLGLRAHRPELPAELEAVVFKCLAKQPEDRFSDVAALANALIPFAGPEAALSARRISRILLGTGVSQSLWASTPPPTIVQMPVRLVLPGAVPTAQAAAAAGQSVPSAARSAPTVQSFASQVTLVEAPPAPQEPASLRRTLARLALTAAAGGLLGVGLGVVMDSRTVSRAPASPSAFATRAAPSGVELARAIAPFTRPPESLATPATSTSVDLPALPTTATTSIPPRAANTVDPPAPPGVIGAKPKAPPTAAPSPTAAFGGARD